MGIGRGRRRWWLPPLAVVAAVVVLRAGFMGLPPGDPDLGGIAYNARLLLNGGIPYVDTFEQKLPGTFFLWAGIFAVGGTGPTALAVVSLLWHVGLAATVYAICRGLWGVGPACAGALLYAVFSASPAVSGSVPNYETWMLLPLLVSLWLVLRWVRSGNGWTLVVAGACGCIGLLMKQQAMFNVALLAAAIPVLGWRTAGPRRGIRACGMFALGGAIPSSMLLAFFVLRGAWPALIECLHPRGLAVYAAAAPWRVVWELGAKHTREIMLEGVALWVLGLSGVVMMFRTGDGRPQAEVRWLVIGWGAASWAGVVAGVRFFQHYYLQFLPFLAIGAAGAWAELRPRLRSPLGLLLAVLIVLSGWRTVIANERVLWWRLKNVVTGSHVPPSLSQQVASHIRSHTTADEHVYVWGHGEDIYHLAGRFAPTRYYKYWAFLSPPPVGEGGLTANPRARMYLEEFLSDMRAHPPRFVVVDPRLSEASPDLVPEFAALLDSSYRPSRVFESVRIYSRVER